MIRERLGILGGGQLGKMVCLDGLRWDLPISVMDKSKDYPAGKVCANFVEGDFSQYRDVLAFGQINDILTIEIEAVNEDALEELEHLGKQVYPSAKALRTIKDKGKQKLFYRNNDFPTAPFELFENKGSIIKGLNTGQLNYPFVQKLRFGGYDGRGVEVISSEQDLHKLFDAPSVVEKKVEIHQEIALIAARNCQGQIAVFDPVEMIFNPHANLVDYLFCPAQISSTLHDLAVKLAIRLIAGLEVVGLLAVEFFIDHNQNLWINEIAPRPHNSGHHTIEACYTSQFQQHLRAICNLPLGDPRLKQPALMLNILGDPDYSGTAIYQGMDTILSIPDVYVHLYGKTETRPYRKMGHLTILGHHLDKLIQCAEVIKQQLKVIA